MAVNKWKKTLPPLSGGLKTGLGPINLVSKQNKDIFGYDSCKIGKPKSLLKTISRAENGRGSLESDYDFSEASSPSASSTASGPICEHLEYRFKPVHLDKVKNKKVKGTKIASAGKDGNKKKESFHSKEKVKKVPVPMKDRQFPMSFWEEPNKPNPVLPPISTHHPDEIHLGINVEKLSIDYGETLFEESKTPKSQVIVSSESGQLTKKLFENIDNDQKMVKQKSGRNQLVGYRKPSNRGDPFLLENIMTKLPAHVSANEHPTLQIMHFKKIRDPPYQQPTLAVNNSNLRKFNEIVNLL